MGDKIKHLQEIMESFPAYIESSQIPDIELYMDQVTTFMETHLAGTKRNSEDKTLTKTMINNYVKDHLIPAPEKKKYSKEHILLLLMIYYSKNILSINDISTILEPITKMLYQTESDYNLEDFYNSLRKQSLKRMDSLKEEIMSQYEEAFSWSDSLNTDDSCDKDLLALYSFIALLGMDISFKKLMIERLIDEAFPNPPSKEKDKKETKEKKNAKNSKKENS